MQDPSGVPRTWQVSKNVSRFHRDHFLGKKKKNHLQMPGQSRKKFALGYCLHSSNVNGVGG